MSQFEFVDFVLIPLTPIHVGGGDEAKLGKESYRIKDNSLERINLRHLLLREGMGGLNLQGKFQEQVFDALREKAKDSDIEETIPLTDDSARELKKGGTYRQGGIDGFQRSGGKPVLPGTTLKGALRTAWLAYRSKGLREVGSHDELARQAFELSAKNDTDTDPFRDVMVADTAIPAGGTKIDRVFTWKKNREGKYGQESTGQMHWEMLRSIANGGCPPLLGVKIGVRSADARKQRGDLDESKSPSRSPKSVEDLLNAMNDHHGPLWKEDIKRFFIGHDQRLNKALMTIRHVFEGNTSHAALVRIGRGSHAESKSIAPFRKIQIRNPHSGRSRIADFGSTRHILSVDGHPVTLGWAVLVPKNHWEPPANWLPEPMAFSTTATSAGSIPILQHTVLYKKGQRILLTDGEEAEMMEDLREGMKDVRVDLNGDTEVVGAHEIQGLVE